MGLIWYFEVICFFYGGEWSTILWIADIINMLQVEYRHSIVIFFSFYEYPGSLGLPRICLQEKCLQHSSQRCFQRPFQSGEVIDLKKISIFPFSIFQTRGSH